MMTTPLSLVIAAALVLPCAAQDQTTAALKVTTRLQPDGSKVVLKTDLEQHIMESTTYDGAEKVKQRIVYALDEQNQPMSSVVYGPKGNALYKCTYKHDALGRITEESDFTLNNQLIRRFVYEFGSTATALRVRAFDAVGNELRQSSGVPDVKKAPPARRRR